MYRAFSVEINDIYPLICDESPKNIFAKVINNSLDSMYESIYRLIIDEDNTLSANQIMKDWFPSINASVFISHSSCDKDDVVRFANWLYNNYGITSFIDSDFWECISDLQKKIDKAFCRLKGEKNTYSYEKRNYSTAHVHMILAHALTRMINQAECFFFIKSENSISIKNTFNRTFSPWIYHELETVDTIELHKPIRKTLLTEDSEIRKSMECFSSKMISYPVKGKRLISIDYDFLNKWKNVGTDKDNLDELYRLVENKNYKYL